jgi:hypothetical protein
MKFEDWIKYEDNRQRQGNPTAWVFLQDEGLYPPQQVEPGSNREKPAVWTMIIQVFNSRRI